MAKGRAMSAGLGWVGAAAAGAARADAHLLKDHDQAGPYATKVEPREGVSLNDVVVWGPGLFQRFTHADRNGMKCDVRTLVECCNVAWDERGKAMVEALELVGKGVHVNEETRNLVAFLLAKTTTM